MNDTQYQLGKRGESQPIVDHSADPLTPEAIALHALADEVGATKDDIIFGAVLGGVIHLLMRDPEIRAMYENNDRTRFIEGLRNSVSFQQKLGQALLTVREAVAR